MVCQLSLLSLIVWDMLSDVCTSNAYLSNHWPTSSQCQGAGQWSLVIGHWSLVVCLSTLYGSVPFIPHRRALSGGICRGSSATTFQLVFITDRQPHSTVYRRRPSFSSRCCSCLEQSAWTRHLRTLRDCLPVPSQCPSISHLISHSFVAVQCQAGKLLLLWTLFVFCYLLTSG